ncbi:MAG: helix-turn-helix domain-containing protein [Firmicutes bacterium]|nr:helix-turn-helix domain-containing protein [Bacillota bacterium]
MDTIAQFSERLKELIFENNITVKKLSQNISCSEKSIYDWLTGKINFVPSVYNLIKLADYFKCSLEFLLGIEQENYLTAPKQRPPFSEWFRSAVEAKGFTLYGLSRKTKMNTGNYYNWINGVSEPSLDSLLRISEALDCSLDYLVGRE